MNLRCALNTKSKNIRHTSTIAEQVLAARDALLAARANRKAAKQAFHEACANMYISTPDGGALPKFERRTQRDGDDDCVIIWHVTAEFIAFDASAKEFERADKSTTHPDFVAMCAAKVALQESKKAHGIALRRLLSVGVKRGGNQ